MQAEERNAMANAFLFVVGFLPLRYVHELASSRSALANILHLDYLQESKVYLRMEYHE